MKNSILKKEIVFLIFLFILTYGVANATPNAPLIGTCYKYLPMVSQPINQQYLNITGITDFRFGTVRWQDIDDIINIDSVASYEAEYFAPLLDSINKYVPDNVECIFQLGFWNAYKMATPGLLPWCNKDVYKVRDEYVQDFKDMCYSLAWKLKGRVNYYVLHNEPDLGWKFTDDDPAIIDTPGPNWRSTPEDFAWQCKICAEQIKAANPDAYIIFGAFAGTDTADVFVQRAMNEIIGNGLPFDAVDFHWYGDLYSEHIMQTVAHSINVFARNRALDWTILETNGPRIVFPLDSIPQGWSESIVDSLNDLSYYLIHNGIQGVQDSIRDCLYAGTRIVDPDNWGLPENFNNVQPMKVDEFNGRVPVFIANGAKIVNWFSAYSEVSPELPSLSYLDEIPCSDNQIMSQTPEGKVETVIKSCQNWPLNVVKVDFGVFGRTDLSDRMKEYIDSLNLPKISPPGQKQMDINLRGITLCNYPNAFNSSTKISYYLPEEMEVKLEMFDILARKVDILDTGIKGKGRHTVIWDAGKYAGGVYFCRLSTSLCSKVIKVTLLK